MTRGTTEALCKDLRAAADRPLPDAVVAEATRSLLNVVGTAIGAARSDAVELVLQYAVAHGGAAAAPVLGRDERLDGHLAAIAAGTAAHYDDFDDTHLETVIHPSAACLGALLAVDPPHPIDGERALRAFALGCEAQLRIGVAMSPAHYDAGWHITGTCGVIGAAVTAGLLLDLDAHQLEHAVGLAACQTLGVRDAFGTMTKPFHPGKAAANGLLAARLAAAGTTGPLGVLDEGGGYFEMLTTEVDHRLVTDDFGERWELAKNAYKPYPCGIVSHPVIDAAVAVAARLAPDDVIDDVRVGCHTLVPELTGNPDPQDGLEARFSTVHGVCAGLLDGTVGLPQYEDRRVRAEDAVALRARITLEVDPAIARDAARVEVTLADGRTITEEVAHARGSRDRPLTDAELDAKVRDLVDPILPGRAEEIITQFRRTSSEDAWWDLVDRASPVAADRGGAA